MKEKHNNEGPHPIKTQNPNEQTSSKHSLQGLIPPPRSLSINANNSLAGVIPSPPQPNAYRTYAEVVRSLPPPRTNRTTPAVSIGSQDPIHAALWMNDNAAGSSGTAAAAAFPISPQPAALGSFDFDKAARSGESLYHIFHPYLRQMDPQPPARTVDLLSRLGAVRSEPPHSRQMDEQPLRTVDFLSNVNNQPWGTVDYLAQMEAASSAPAAQVPRENPPIETIVQWASSLRVGDGRRRKVDLNLKLKMV